MKRIKKEVAFWRDILLADLMKLIPDDEFVIIFLDGAAGPDGYREEDALFNGLALDWWKEEAAVAKVAQMRVVGIRPAELETVAGPVIMIQAEL